MRKTLALASEDHPWSLLIRHATRPPIPAGSFGNDLLITDEGRRHAMELGGLLQGRLGRLVTSPVLRCVETAQAIRRGAHASARLTTDITLGDPGVWIADGHAVGDAFLKDGPRGVVARQLAGDAAPGMTPLDLGVTRFLKTLLSTQGGPGQIDVFVSHDAVIAPLLGALLESNNIAEIWPEYLEGTLLNQSGGVLAILWRGTLRTTHWRPA